MEKVNKDEEKKVLKPEIIIKGSKKDLLGIKEPVHMCSNCWIKKDT